MSWIEQTDPNFNGLDLRSLRIDQCFLNITSSLTNQVYLYYLSDDCHKCPFTKLEAIAPNYEENVIKIDTSRKFQLKVFQDDLGRYALDE